ncbi:hypothetical protein GCM10007979_48860 [Nocardioides albus]|nr:hypothetical protein GCM10007979_48860 [Nocardioides albus]
MVAAGGVDFSATLGVADVAPGEVNTVHITGLCVKGSGDGVVTAVEAAPNSGLVVRRFTVLKEMAEVGGAKDSFENLGLESDRRAVEQKCGKGIAGSALYVEIEPSGSKSVHSPYLTIESEVAGINNSFRYPLGLTLCVVGEKNAKFCKE